MKQKFEIEIDASATRVWAAFTNPTNMKRWVQNFESITVTSGEAGQPGSTADVVFNENGKKVVLKETVTERREGTFFAGTYESPHGATLIVHHFEPVDDHTTRWTSWCNFTFKGFMRFLSLFIAGAIRKRTEGDMARFKLMVETDEAND